MNLIERIKAKTPRKNKVTGKISTVIGVACASALGTGLIVNPIAIVALTVGSVVFGGKALFDAQKVIK